MAIKLYTVKCIICEKETKYRRKYRLKKCPHCHSSDPYWDKPKDEYILFHLQDKYLETKSKDVLGEIYSILLVYTKKIINNYLLKGKKWLSKSELYQKAHDSVCKIIEYYMEKPEFKIDNSFAGYVLMVSKYFLFSKRKEDENDSLNHIIDDNKENQENVHNNSRSLQDIIDFDYEKIFKEDMSEILLEKINYIFNKTIDKISKKSKLESLYTIIGLYHYISNSKFINEYYEYFGNNIKNYVDNIMYIVYNTIKNIEESQNI